MLSDVQPTVGPYRIVERHGAGGMGIVYLAEDPRLGRRVALKRVSDPALSTPDARAHLLREAAMAATLNHPNIATVYDVLEEDGRPYIVMEYVPGETLSTQLSNGPLAIDRVVQIGLQLWLYLTPIAYPLERVPVQYRGWIALNPLSGIVEGFRSAVVYGREPDWPLLGLSAAVSVAALAAALLLFKRLDKYFADVI